MRSYRLAAALVALLQFSLALPGCAFSASDRHLAAAPAPAPPPLLVKGEDPEQRRVAQAQRRLRALGLYRGTTNGTLGPQTRSALQAYQRQVTLPVTGQLDEHTAYALENNDLLHLCTARGIAAIECLGTIRQFHAAIAQDGAATAADDAGHTPCDGETDVARCAKAVAEMSQWLGANPAAPQ